MLIHLEKLGKSFGEKVVLHDVTASVEREDRIGIVGQNGAGKTTLLKILTGKYQDYDGEFSVTHGVTLGYLEQNAKLDPTLDIYGEMRATFAPVLDAMAQMQVLERKMAAQPDNTDLLAQHDALQNIVDAADGYNMDVNIKKVLSGMGFAQDTWEKNIAVLSGGELTRLRLAKLLLEKPDVLILDEPTNHLDFATMEWLENYLKGYSGAVLVVDERTSVIGFLRMTQEFFSHESCGQCTPCREGNRHISLLLDKVAEGTHTAQDIATLKKFADIMSSASLCGLGETAQSALLSCMKRFPEVFAVKEEVAVR